MCTGGTQVVEPRRDCKGTGRGSLVVANNTITIILMMGYMTIDMAFYFFYYYVDYSTRSGTAQVARCRLL